MGWRQGFSVECLFMIYLISKFLVAIVDIGLCMVENENGDKIHWSIMQTFYVITLY